MTKIICLVGASGSGKTSIAKELEKRGHNAIQSYTTRAARYESEWGHTFIKGKLSDNGMDIVSGCGVFERENMIAYFNSYNSGNHYFATDDQVIKGKVNIYTVDPKGAEMVHKYYEGTDVDVVTIYLEVDEQIRAERLVRRVNDGYCITPKDNPKVWKRIRPDRKLFRVVKCDYAVNGNRSLEKVLEAVEQII